MGPFSVWGAFHPTAVTPSLVHLLPLVGVQRLPLSASLGLGNDWSSLKTTPACWETNLGLVLPLKVKPIPRGCVCPRAGWGCACCFQEMWSTPLPLLGEDALPSIFILNYGLTAVAVGISLLSFCLPSRCKSAVSEGERKDNFLPRSSQAGLSFGSSLLTPVKNLVTLWLHLV